MDHLLVEFLTETNENLAALEVALVRLERDPQDGSTLSQIFRLVHTIKGTCGFLGLRRLEKLAHAGENLLSALREGQLHPNAEMVTTLLVSPNALVRMTIARVFSAAIGGFPERLDAVRAGTPGGQGVGPVPMKGGIVDGAPAAVQSIRVGVDLLESLMMLVSELALTRDQILQVARSQESGPFAVLLQRLSHITTDLQEGVMKTRMQPIGTAWAKLPRRVRDLAQELDKRIELVMRGADTEIDREVLALIEDPLTHMVRNSADHGLELPVERRAAGKSETGHIFLNAYHEGGHIIIEIRDDGRGVPVDKIRAKAVAEGMASEAELAGMTNGQILRFIFRPGFSTAATVTAVSGRGVGMDVVKTNVERIGGTIDLESVEGRGTIFTIKVPLRCAIVPALIGQAGAERFAIPHLRVVEAVRAGAKASDGQGGGEAIGQMIDQTPVLRVRDRLVPLVDLNATSKLGAAKCAAQGHSCTTVLRAAVAVG